MARVKNQLKRRRIFSEELRKKIVRDIEKGKASVLSASREYDVSQQCIYNWLSKYSRYLQSEVTLVMQMQSEGYKTKELEERIAELEAALGRKQMEIDFLKKRMEISEEELDKSHKKKSSTKPSVGSGKTKNSTSTNSKNSTQ
jgi:transposase-like protein